MRIFVFTLLFLTAPILMGQETLSGGSDQPDAPKTLSDLAQDADFIGLVQVQGIDYDTVRDIPAKGYAILSTLIVYRHPGEPNEELDHIQVFAEGFETTACYYPQRWNEGRRYLVFLEQRKKKGYKGNKPYCMLPVLITNDFRYALRYPVPGVELKDQSVIQELTFRDPDAYVQPGKDIPYSIADAYQARGHLKALPDNRLVFTRGIYMGDVRRLMFGE